ncbi:MAG: tyrosine-type recombinase/integrase [Acidobacteriota bacterium]|nr:tyrosine-type recombinase/integrase [Acidobacteriota bacterium]
MKKIRDVWLDDVHLPAWFQAVQELPNLFPYGAMARDFLLLVLFSGLRMNEAATLKRSHVKEMSGVMVFDIPAGTMKVRCRHVLPLSDVLVELTERRQAVTDSAFLFPAPNKPSSSWCTNQKVSAHIAGRVGFRVTHHPLRKTFSTLGIAAGVPKAHIQQFLAHKESMLDQHYLQTYLPALERSMETVSRFIFEKATAPSRRKQRRVRERLLANAYPTPHLSERGGYAPVEDE